MLAYTLTFNDLKKSATAILQLDDTLESFSLNPKIFTTFIAYLDKKQKSLSIKFPNKHWQRLLIQAQELNIKAQNLLLGNSAILKESIIRIIQENFDYLSSEELIFRVVLEKETILIFIDSYQSPWNNKFKISLKSIIAERPFAHLKTSITTESKRAQKEAEQNGFDDAILIDSNSQITECSWANIFWIENDNNLYTTPSKNILSGITRNGVIKEFPCLEKEITLGELCNNASEIFITKSTTGITAVDKIDNFKLENDKESTLLTQIRQWYWRQNDLWEIS